MAQRPTKNDLFQTLDSLDEDDPDPEQSSFESKLPWAILSPSASSAGESARPHTSPNPGTVSKRPGSPVAPVTRRNTEPDIYTSPRARSESQDSVQITSAHIVAPALTPADIIVGDTPRPLTAAEKKKKNFTIPQRPVSQQLFKGFVFHFVPNSDIGPPRNYRIRKAIEYGAKWTREWHPLATHIIVDRHVCKADLEKFIGLDNIKPSTFIVDEIYTTQCIENRMLMDATHYKHLIKGFESENPRKRRCPQTPEPMGQDSSRSLQIKAARRTTVPQDTPDREEESDPEELFEGAVQMPRTAFRAQSSVRGSCDLDLAIAEAKKVIHLPLDSDEDDNDSSRQKSSDISDEPQEQASSSKTNAPHWQKNFACMRDPAIKESFQKSPNAPVIALLQEMADYYAGIGDQWRIRAYRIAISSLRKCPKDITHAEEARQLWGIGPRLAAKIEEIKWTSCLRRLENAKLDESDQALRVFTKIYGVGISVASRWVSQGYRTLQDLKTHDVELTRSQKIGIEHYDDFAQRIPRNEVTQHASIVTQALRRIDPAFNTVVSGSYRRGSQTCGDIDLMITHPTNSLASTRRIVLDTLVPRLTASGFLTAALAVSSPSGGTKWHGASQLPAQPADDDAAAPRPWRRLDLLLVPADELGAALLYFTGNDVFNRSMRLLARRKGMRLNQRGLYRDVMRGRGGVKLNEGTRVAGEDERQIFDMLGVPWRECTERDA